MKSFTCARYSAITVFINLLLFALIFTATTMAGESPKTDTVITQTNGIVKVEAVTSSKQLIKRLHTPDNLRGIHWTNGNINLLLIGDKVKYAENKSWTYKNGDLLKFRLRIESSYAYLTNDTLASMSTVFVSDRAELPQFYLPIILFLLPAGFMAGYYKKRRKEKTISFTYAFLLTTFQCYCFYVSILLHNSSVTSSLILIIMLLFAVTTMVTSAFRKGIAYAGITNVFTLAWLLYITQFNFGFELLTFAGIIILLNLFGWFIGVIRIKYEETTKLKTA